MRAEKVRSPNFGLNADGLSKIAGSVVNYANIVKHKRELYGVSKEMPGR